MTVTADMAKRIETFSVMGESQILDQQLLYMVMNDLAAVELSTLSWTSRAILHAHLTENGRKHYDEYLLKRAEG